MQVGSLDRLQGWEWLPCAAQVYCECSRTVDRCSICLLPAVEAGAEAVACYLVDIGADVNARNAADKRTVIEIAGGYQTIPLGRWGLSCTWHGRLWLNGWHCQADTLRSPLTLPGCSQWMLVACQ